MPAHALEQHSGIGRLAPTHEQRLEGDEDDETKDHADAGRAEAPTPAPILPEPACDDRTDGGAGVHAHIEDRVGGIPADVGARVQLAHDHRDVRLHEARANDDEGQGQPEDADHGVALPARSLEGHEAMSAREDDAAEQHGLALTQPTIRKIAAEQRRNVDEASICPIDQVRLAVVVQPVLGEIEDEQRAHPVIGKALPHLGEEQDDEALGMAEHFGLRARDQIGSREQEGDERNDPADEDDGVEVHCDSLFMSCAARAMTASLAMAREPNR